MSNMLQKLIKRSVDKKIHISKHNDDIDFQTLYPKKVSTPDVLFDEIKGKPDQCFVIVPDVHSYIRDKKAFDVFMAALPHLQKHYNVTKFVQLGDLLECGKFSAHPVSCVQEVIPEYVDEINWAMNDFWTPAMKSLPNANFYALMGNHEERLNKYIATRMGHNDLAATIYNDLMPYKLYEDKGIHVTPYGRADISEGVLELFPGLVCIHGWSIAKNAAKAHLDQLTGGNSVIFGHTHRMQSEVRRNPLNNGYVGAYSFGSLARVSMNWHYGKPMDHTLGFGLVFTYGKQFFVRTVEILIDGDKRVCLLPNGEIISA